RKHQDQIAKGKICRNTQTLHPFVDLLNKLARNRTIRYVAVAVGVKRNIDCERLTRLQRQHARKLKSVQKFVRFEERHIIDEVRYRPLLDVESRIPSLQCQIVSVFRQTESACSVEYVRHIVDGVAVCVA